MTKVATEASDWPADCPAGWARLPFAACVSPQPMPHKASVPQSEFKRTGRFPVVDQGAGLIAGYTDEEEVVYKNGLPVIVFGDHTRVFKFIDFPFATGADGTKLLRANERVIEPRFLYFGLLHLEIPSRGYNRHFKYLKDQFLPVPGDPGEQQAIAYILSRIQAAVEVQEKIVATLRELKAATMAKLFREGLRGEPLKQTDIGYLPSSWQARRVGDIAKVSTGTTPATDRKEYYRGDVPFVRTAEIEDNVISAAREHISRAAVEKYGLRVYPPGSIFLAMYGQGKTRGRAALLGIGAATTQHTAAIEPGPEIDGHFLWHYLLSQYEALRSIGNLGHLSHLNLGYVQALLVPVPPMTEQLEIGDALARLHKRLVGASRHREVLRHIFSSMLHNLMTGRVRVTHKMIALQALEARRKTQKRHTGRVDEEKLHEIVRRIVEAVEPEKIILFGSAARGEMGPDSDVDLLVVKSCEDRREVWERIARRLIGIGVPKDIIVATPEDIETYGDRIGLIYRPALREGRVIYAA